MNILLDTHVTLWSILDPGRVPGPAEEWLPTEVERAGLAWRDVGPEDALAVRALPWHHRDPFDRLLVAQVRRGWHLATADRAFEAYGIPILWR